ncbi:uncharacterized protein CEXT_223641 [Caerostris extrusa]|uniref:Uncharacterized protein n=1 Tax=Caerostris extrusa TaxID=172846 RepID=A0AAV4XX67_CAEEX|nr:uncharacterized protein CEXT_223641 [Caerostris extrusa]
MKLLELSNHSRIIIHMCPLNTVKAQKLHRRKLKILFSNGCTCFFKLLVSYGCGSAWSKWRNLEHLCNLTRDSYSPKWTLIRFGELDVPVQNYMSSQKFGMSRLINGNIALRESDGEQNWDDRLLSHPAIIKTDGSATNFDKDKLEYDPTREKLIKKSDLLLYPPRESKSDWKTKGQEIIEEDHFEYIEPKRTIVETEESCFEYIEPRRIVVETEKIYSKPKGTVSKVERDQEDKALKASTARMKPARKTRVVRRFGEGIPEGCITDLLLSYSDSTSNEESANLNHPKAIRRVGTREGKAVSENELIEKHSVNPNEDEITKRILEVSACCPNVSSILLIRKGFKRSSSEGSLISIESSSYWSGYLKANLSMPNLDEFIVLQK